MAPERRDLGDLLHQLSRIVIGHEISVLGGLDVEMWDYAVLTELGRGPAPTQAQLAHAVGRDTTRLIVTLDRLEKRNLLRRDPDPTDRRNRIVTLTGAGKRLLAESRAAVRALEAELLVDLNPQQREDLFVTLQLLAGKKTAAGGPA